MSSERVEWGVGKSGWSQEGFGIVWIWILEKYELKLTYWHDNREDPQENEYE